ncbi:hypothetical protein J4Q44_G00164530 [Coregonus suidteri]|uniref:Uncharacterized protein n=1 Tax=Coregonus suidteri TaxID=861788 RepID=A0AAN8LXZ4_9TELE
MDFPNKVPQQLSALTLNRYEQPVVDYCQAQGALHLNMGFEPPSQAQGCLRPSGCSTGHTAGLPSAPTTSLIPTDPHSLQQ